MRPEVNDLALALQREWDDAGFMSLWDMLHDKQKRLVQVFWVNGMTESDLRQELFLDLVRAIKTWDAKRGRSFDSWVDLRWHGKLCSLISKSLNLRNKMLSGASSLNDVTDVSGGDEEHYGETRDRLSSITAESDVDQRDRIGELRWRLLVLYRDLTVRERLVVRLYRLGLHFKEIAVRLRISQKSVDNAVRRARVKSQHLARGWYRHLSYDDSRKRIL